jgi:transposase-like protein
MNRAKFRRFLRHINLIHRMRIHAYLQMKEWRLNWSEYPSDPYP